jgi:hypothetical protein
VIDVASLVNPEVRRPGVVGEAVALDQPVPLDPRDLRLAEVRPPLASTNPSQSRTWPISSAAWRRSSGRSGSASAASALIVAIASTAWRYWPE